MNYDSVNERMNNQVTLQKNGIFVNDNTLTVYIKRIREKLDDLEEQKIITTVRGVGYKIGDINE